MSLARDLRLEVVLRAIDKVTAPLKNIGAGSRDAGREVATLRDRLKELERNQKSLAALNDTGRGLAVTKVQLRKAQEQVKALREQIAQTPAPTKAMRAALKAAENESAALGMKHGKLYQRHQQLTEAVKVAGLSTTGLTKQQSALKAQAAEVNATLQAQLAHLKALNAQQAKMHAARATYDKTMAGRDKLAGAGVSMGIAGAAIGAPVLAAVKAYSSFEDAMLGVARQVDGARDKNGQLTAVYYDMAEAVQRLSQRLPMATTEIAALIEAGARMGIQGKENLLAFAETTAIAATAFDLPVEQIGENMGKIAALYKVPIKNIGELGDVINYLDDNAQSKGGDIIEVMQRIAGLSDKLDYRKAAALGSTFLSLGSSAEVAASASNAMVRELAIAQMQPKRFQEGLKALRLSAKDVQRGMSKDATGTIVRVLEAIKRLPQDAQLSVTTQLFGKEFGDDAAKLANNLDEYKRQLQLVNGETAKGSMQREADARNQALSARWLMVQNRLFNAQASLGATLRGTLVELMEAAAGVLDRVTGWVRAHPALAGTLMKATALVAGLLIGMGGLTLALAALIGPFAVIRYGMAMFNIEGATALAKAGELATKALPAVGRALLMVGRSLTLTPVGLIVTGIALALAAVAALIYKYWQPIKAFLGGVWDGFTAATGPLMTVLDSLIDAFRPIWDLVAPAFRKLGAWLGELLTPVQATTAETDKLAASGKKVGEILAVAFTGVLVPMRAALGMIKAIHQTVATVIEASAHVVTGDFSGAWTAIKGGAGKVWDTISSADTYVGKRSTTEAKPIGAAPLRVERQPPVRVPTARAAAGAAGTPTTIHVYAAPGMDENALAAKVDRHLERRKQADAARQRGALSDRD